MSEKLLSVGLDVGTTSTQMVVSQLEIENRASGFAVPEMEIAGRRILYRSPIHFTPLKGVNLVNGAGVREIVEEEYRKAGIQPKDVDTGAVIITGETSRKENARQVLDALAEYAGDFVVATAGPDLESVLAAKGAGAVEYSAQTGKTVLHMDIGGGTSNLALIRDGKIVETGCLNVGGRLLKFDSSGVVTYVSPVLDGLCERKVGETATEEQARSAAEVLVQALEMAAGLRERTKLLERLWTQECGPMWASVPTEVTVSFSGGVADCIEKRLPWLKFGDLGPVLGQMIRQSRLCAGEYRLGSETIRATVIGAGCHSAQLSGSTVFYRNVDFPLKNVPVIRLEEVTAEGIRRVLSRQEDMAVLAMPGTASPGYREIVCLAQTLMEGFGGKPVLVCLEQDMAKALGQALAVRMPGDESILCIDRVRVTEESFLDIGAPVGPALPVVVKTLVLGK